MNRTLTFRRIAPIIGLILAAAYVVFGSEATFEWEPAPATGVTNYAVYGKKIGTTNQIRVNAGTNLTVTVSNLTSGLWVFWATATIEITESEPSNTATNHVPPPPLAFKLVP